MHERMTLTDIARHIGCSRPTAYKIVRSVGFPRSGGDKRWERADVLDWLACNKLDAAVVAGVIVRTADVEASG